MHLTPSLAPYTFASLDHRSRAGRVFGIRPPDLLRHMVVVGISGSGKSTLLERLLLQQAERGDGWALIDPHGDLTEHVLAAMPRHRTNDVVVIAPGDVTQPVGINPFDAPGIPRWRTASAVVSVFRKCFPDAWGPRSEHLLRNIVLALLEIPGTTFLSALRMLHDTRYRDHIVARVRDPVVRLFWTREFAALPPTFAAEVKSPLLNKLGAALSSPALRNTLGQVHSRFDLRAAMDDGRIVLVDVAKGRLGEDASGLLGALVLAQIQLAAYARIDQEPASRRPFAIYVDEVGSFATPSFAQLAEEGRKFGVALVTAMQHTGQLDEPVRRALFTNAATRVLFRVGAEDARLLADDFGPQLSHDDLAGLAQHQIAVRLCIDGVTCPPFTARTLEPAQCDPARAALLRRASRERYGRPQADVEQSVLRQLGELPKEPRKPEPSPPERDGPFQSSLPWS